MTAAVVQRIWFESATVRIDPEPPHLFAGPL